ncbi:hypothetical protein E4U59_007808 [Claviceps monticola]|nr:hypothetical protein E4U59_007808 [Claviceps monticola]
MAPSPRIIISTSLAAHRRVSPNIFPPAGFDRIDELVKVIRDQYQVIAKLGYGASSPTWLALDLFARHSCTTPSRAGDAPVPEVPQSEHFGCEQIRLIEDHFTIQGSHGSHIVFVLPPLGVSVKLLQELQPGGVYEEHHAVLAIERTVLALELPTIMLRLPLFYVRAGNLLLGITDESQLAQFEDNERMRPTPRKVIGDRVIHVSQMLMTAADPPHLCEIGHARICPDSELQTGLIMPTQYRAPEVLLDRQCDFAVDLWSIGIFVWELLEPKGFFQIYDFDRSNGGTPYSLRP